MNKFYNIYLKNTYYHIYLALNSFIYYCVWFLCLFFVIKSNTKYYLHLAFLLTFVQYIFYLIVSKEKLKFNFFILAVTVLAIIIDSTLYNFHLIFFEKNNFHYFSPFWVILMWLSFAITFYITSHILFSRFYILGLLALIFVPFSYAYINFFHAITIKAQWILFFYGFIWAILLPLICFFTARNKI